MPALVERLPADDGLKGTLVSIDAIATNAAIAKVIRGAGADYLLAVKANQPTLRAEIDDAPADCPTASSISTRRMAASRSAPSPSAARLAARRPAPLTR